jgi:hypothetical protein
VTASGVRAEEPMADGGRQLLEWAFGAEAATRHMR